MRNIRPDLAFFAPGAERARASVGRGFHVFQGKTTRIVEAGDPTRRGATFDGQGTNFALFSGYAERVELCLFDTSGNEIERITLPEYTERNLARLRSRGSAPASSTATAFTGPINPEAGHRFNPNKLLIDPYAKLISGEIKWGQPTYGYKFDDPSRRSLVRRDRQRRLDAEMRRHRAERSRLRQAGRACRWSTRHHLRNPRARLHQAASGSARGAAEARSRAWPTRT